MAPTTSTSRNPRPVRHGRERFFIEGEGVVGPPGDTDGEMVPRAHLESSTAHRAAAFAAPTFRFSRVGPRGTKLPDATLRKVAQAMTARPPARRQRSRRASPTSASSSTTT